MGKIRQMIARMMYGRYGSDKLSQFMILVSLVVLIVTNFISIESPLRGGLMGVVLLLLGGCYFRMFSKNISKRYAENQKFLTFSSKVTGIFKKERRMLEQRKVYHIYKCPSCKQKVRVPKGKGKIEVRCPKCSTTFVKKS